MHWCIAHLMHGAAIGRRLAPRGGQIPYPRLRSMFGREGFGAQQARCCCSSSSREGSGEEANNATALFFFPFFPSLLWVYHNVLRFQSGQTCHQRCSILCFYSKKSCSSRRTRVFCSHLFPFSSYLSLSLCGPAFALYRSLNLISLPVSAVSSSPCQSLSLPFFSVAVPFLLLLLCFRPRATHAQSRRKRAPQAGAKRKQAENAPHLQEQRRQEAERDDAANDEFPFV